LETGPNLEDNPFLTSPTGMEWGGIPPPRIEIFQICGITMETKLFCKRNFKWPSMYREIMFDSQRYPLNLLPDNDEVDILMCTAEDWVKKLNEIIFHNKILISTKLPNPINETRVSKLVFITIPFLKFWAQGDSRLQCTLYNVHDPC